MQRNSNQDYDGQNFGTATLAIGKKGLDLRQSVDQNVLTRLENARFVDATTVEQRTGHRTKILQDAGNFPQQMSAVGDEFIYGYGTTNVSPITGQHYPIYKQNKFTFNYDGNDISWTGDRLLIHSNDDTSTCLGASRFWNNHKTTKPVSLLPAPDIFIKPHGIPCYIPSLIDYTPPVRVQASSVAAPIVTTVAGTKCSYDVALSETLRAVVYTQFDSNGNCNIYAQIINRETNSLVSLTQLNANIATITNDDVRVVYSNNTFVAYWRDITTGQLYTSNYRGLSAPIPSAGSSVWSTEVSLVSADSYDVWVPVAGAAHYLLYRQGVNIKCRYYSGAILQTGPVAVDQTITSPSAIGPVSIATDIDGKIGILWYSVTGYKFREYDAQLVTQNGVTVVIDSSTNPPDACSLVSQLTVDATNGRSCWVCYAGYLGGGNKGIRIVSTTNTAKDTLNIFKFNCSLVSRAFRVGDETFAWLQSGNSQVNFLVAGVLDTQVCAFADRGEAASQLSTATLGRVVTGISIDPLDPYNYAWARAITATADITNHLRYSDIQFLPQITAAQYGKSVYLSGSAVQNFDGVECSDAGFHDFPIVNSGTPGGGGALTAGVYSIRVYAVRYNNKGEKFVSPAATSLNVTAAASGRIDWLVRPVVSCTTNDAVLEFYRTQAGGTTYNLEGTISNAKNSATVAFTSIQSDAAISVAPGDPYQPQLGGLADLLENGPVGCTTLISHNDRIFCVGGQVPPGQIQFSKKKTTNFGAGFSALSGFTTVDSEGGKINSIAGMNSAIIALENNKIFVIQDDGPDNFGRGNFPAAKFAAAKGATTHFGTILTDIGLAYWNEGGPHILSGNFTVDNISDQIRPLAINLTPTGVRLNAQRQEVVWYTAAGTALLWDYKSSNRWATWSNLYINAVSSTALAGVNGLLYIEDSSLYTDGGQEYVFAIKTAQLRTDELLEGYTLLRRYGLVGVFEGNHTLEFRVYYNGSPLWEEDETWNPTIDTYLQVASTYGDLTAAEMDAIITLDKSGNYATHRRSKRQNCQRFQLEFMDNGPGGPSFSPQSLEFELGARPGLGRNPVTTFQDK